jgi:hypothetical protein
LVIAAEIAGSGFRSCQGAALLLNPQKLRSWSAKCRDGRTFAARPARAHPDRTAATTLLALIRTAIVGTVIAIQPVLMAVCLEAIRAIPHRAPEGEGLSEMTSMSAKRLKLAALVVALLGSSLVAPSGASADCLRRVYNRSTFVLVARQNDGPPATILPGHALSVRLSRPGKIDLSAYCGVPGVDGALKPVIGAPSTTRLRSTAASSSLAARSSSRSSAGALLAFKARPRSRSTTPARGTSSSDCLATSRAQSCAEAAEPSAAS